MITKTWRKEMKEMWILHTWRVSEQWIEWMRKRLYSLSFLQVDIVPHMWHDCDRYATMQKRARGLAQHPIPIALELLEKTICGEIKKIRISLEVVKTEPLIIKHRRVPYRVRYMNQKKNIISTIRQNLITKVRVHVKREINKNKKGRQIR